MFTPLIRTCTTRARNVRSPFVVAAAILRFCSSGLRRARLWRVDFPFAFGRALDGGSRGRNLVAVVVVFVVAFDGLWLLLGFDVVFCLFILLLLLLV